MSPTGTPRGVAISWAAYSRRSRMFARELDVPHYCIAARRPRGRVGAPVRYGLQAVRTFHLLFRLRPQLVHVQNPPCFCGLVVALYCRIAGARYVLDHHSASFLPIWRLVAPVQRAVVRRAVTNVVTTEQWAGVVRSWGGRAVVMRDAFHPLPEGTAVDLGPGRHVAFVGTFAFDEPLTAVIAVARRLSHVRFHVTGDLARAPAGLEAMAPPNVVFTGFRPYEEYVGLLRAVDVVMALTTRDLTLQGAGCEAVSVGTPLVTSDWPYLREVFEGMVFTDATPRRIRGAVEEALARQADLAAAIVALRETRRREWDTRLAELRSVLGAGPARAPAAA
jgi:glycosyltransferase involved in cell wall biosynthesis